MADTPSHKSHESQHEESNKKLRKREKRLLRRLEEAYIAQRNAAERFQRAEARLLKRLARTQRLEGRIEAIRQKLGISAFPNTDTSTTMRGGIENADTTTAIDSTEPQITDAPEISTVGNDTADEQSKESLDPADLAAKALEARAAATATEQAARLAIDHALHVAAIMEQQLQAENHQSEELRSLEEQAAHASAAALDAELAAQEAERQVDIASQTSSLTATVEANADGEASTFEELHSQTPSPTTTFEPADQASISIDANEHEDTSEPVSEQIPPIGEPVVPTQEVEMLHEHEAVTVTDDETPTSPSAQEELSTPLHDGLPTPVEQERVEEIEEDENMVQMVASMVIADAAAAHAAKAEALAEEASLLTEEARHFAAEADEALERVRSAIRSGASMGDAAEAILFDAERDATHAHAILANAEAAEERARRAAMAAEADAEVAEGMAFATEDISENDEIRHEDEREYSASTGKAQHAGDTGELERLSRNDAKKRLEEEDTVEVPIVHPGM